MYRWCSLPYSGCHIYTVVSSLPETILLPSSRTWKSFDWDTLGSSSVKWPNFDRILVRMLLVRRAACYPAPVKGRGRRRGAWCQGRPSLWHEKYELASLFGRPPE
jgi:hypothetical protein